MNALDPQLAAIQNLCCQHQVQQLYVFGSALTPTFRPQSDVDLVVSFRQMPVEQYADNYFALKFALEELLERPIDLLEQQALTNPYFQAELAATQHLLYAA